MCRFFVFIFCLTLPIIADQIELKNGSKISGKAIYNNGEFFIDNEYFQRETVKKISIGKIMGTVADIGTSEISPEVIAKWKATADSMEREYPNAKGLILYDFSRQTLTPDGREVDETRFTGKVLTQDTKWWSNRAWYIDEGINRVKILYARSISPDGKIYNYSPDDITYSEPARGTVFFGKGKTMSLTIPGVEIGSFIDYCYIVETYAPEDPELFTARFFIQSDEPVKIARCEFEVPKKRELFYETFLLKSDDPWIGKTIKNLPSFEGKPEPQIVLTDTSKIYIWEFKNIEPIIDEPNSQSYINISPSIIGGLYKDYRYYHRRFGGLHSEHIKLTPQLDSLAKSIVGDETSETGKIAKIYHWVQRNIRYISVKGALASRFGGHYAQITYDNKYGDCTDKAVLFSTLLKAVGIESYPIILMTNDAGFVDRKRFPYWGGNHAVSEVWWDGKPHVLDATNNLFRFPTYSMGNCDIYYANFVRGAIEYNPPIEPEYNAMQSKTIVALSPDNSATITDSMWFVGNMEASYRGFFQFMPKMRHRLIAEQMVAQRKSGAKLESFEVENVDDISLPFSMRFEYKVANYPIKAGEYLLIEVPALRYSFPEIDLKERNFGIKLDQTFMRTHDVTFILPNGIKPLFVPDSIHIENEYFDYSAKYEIEGSFVKFTDRYRIKALRVPISDYELYKSDALKILAYLKERIFLVKG